MNVLIIDDSDLKISCLKECLEEEGNVIIVKSDYMTAIKYILMEKHTIDLIFLDMGFGILGKSDYNAYQGLNLLNELEMRNIYIPIIINSSTELDDESLNNIQNLIYTIKRFSISEFKVAMQKYKERLKNRG